MNILGKWTLKGIKVPAENGMTYYHKNEVPEEYQEGLAEAAATDLEFLEDGTYNMIQKAEGELAEIAKAEGYEIREDGYVVALTAKWEDRDGVIYYDTGAEGTVLDEEIDPFMPLEFDEDGCMWFNYGMLLYEHM